MVKLTKIVPGQKELLANGKKYLIEDRISQRRYPRYLEAQIRLGLGVSFQQTFDRLQDLYEAINQQRFADSAVITRDLMQGLADEIDGREPAIIELCAMFINEENEDRRYITDAQIKQKAKDWELEGIEMESFFLLALSFIPGFVSAYKKFSQDYSLTQSQTQNTNIGISEPT